MKYNNRTISGLLFFCVCLLAGCGTIREEPGDNPVDPTLIEVSFSLDVNMEMEELDRIDTYASILNGDHDIRYIVDIYTDLDAAVNSAEGGRRVQRIVYTDDEIAEGKLTIGGNIKLPADKYRLLIWVDFVGKGKSGDLYYDTQDLRSVSIIRDGGYVGYRTARDAFSACTSMDLTPYRGERFVRFPASVTVERPFAVYQIVTTDIEKYLSYNPSLSYGSIRPGIANFSYLTLFPTGYNVRFGVPDDFKPGIGYRFDIVETVPQSEAVVASDMVFVNGDDAAYDAAVEICTPDGTHINTAGNLRINLRRNKLTVLRGEYLTRETGGGGIGIDPGFVDEIIVPIN